MKTALSLRWIMAILVTALLAQGLAACAPKPTPAPPAPTSEGKKVAFTFACFSGAVGHYKALAEDFGQAHPDIEVQVKLWSEIADKELPPSAYIRQLASGADTFEYPNKTVSDDFGQGSLLDLTPLIAKDPSFDIDEFFPQLVNLFRWRKRLFGLPAEADVDVIFYNKDLFDEAGVEYPRIGWSWDDFLAKAAKLTKGEGEDKRYGFCPLFMGWFALVYSHGGLLADDSVDPPIPTLDDPLVVEATQWYVDLALKHGVMPNPEEMGWDAISGLQRAGRIAMWQGGARQLDFYSRYLNVGVAPFPKDEIPVNPYFPFGCFISAGTAHPQECWEWIKYISQKPFMEYSTVPARRSGVAELKRKVGEEAADVLLYILENGVPPSAQFYRRHYRSAVEEAMKGKEVEEALSDAQEEALRLAEELRGRLSSTPEPFAVATSPPEGKGVTITFQAFGLGTSVALFPYKELAQAFNELHPDVEVRLERQVGSRLDETAASADCFLWPVITSPEEGEDSLLNLQPLLEEDVDFSLDDFYPVALEAWRWEGDLWGLPAHISPYVIFYNRDLFDEAGVEYPRIGWSWDDFLAKAAKLTKGEGEDKQYGFVSVPGEAIIFIYASGGSPVDDLREPTSPTLDDPLVVEGVRRWFDLAFEYGVMPLFPSKFMDDPLPYDKRSALVQAGRAAMWMSSPDSLAWNRAYQAIRPKIGMAPMPIGKEKATFLRIPAYVISKDTKHPKECWEWIKYLSQQMPENYMPARCFLAESPEFQEGVGEEFVKACLASLPYENIDAAYHAPWFKWVNQLFMWTLEGIADGADVGAALSEAQRRAESYLSCLESHSELSWEEREEACRGELGLPPFEP